MSSEAISGIGTKFYRWSPNSSEWQAIAEVVSIGGPSKSRDTIEVTSFDSEDGYKEFIGSLRDAGAINLTLNYRRDTYEIMNDDFESELRQNYKIVLPDTEETTFEFEGLVTELPLNVALDDKISVETVIKVSGKVALYDGSSGA